MAKKHKKHVHTDPEELENKEVFEVLKFLKKYGKYMAGGAALLLVAYIAYAVNQQIQVNKENAAAQALASARQLQDLKAVVNNFPDTAVAPAAILEIANRTFHQGNYEQALIEFDRFAEKYPDHRNMKTVELSRAYCREAMLQLEEAMVAYQEFAEKYEGDPMAPLALFGQARIYEMQGLLQDAKAVYEDYIASDAEGIWVPQAETALRYLERQMRAEAEQRNS